MIWVEFRSSGSYFCALYWINYRLQVSVIFYKWKKSALQCCFEGQVDVIDLRARHSTTQVLSEAQPTFFSPRKRLNFLYWLKTVSWTSYMISVEIQSYLCSLKSHTVIWFSAGPRMSWIHVLTNRIPEMLQHRAELQPACPAPLSVLDGRQYTPWAEWVINRHYLE